MNQPGEARRSINTPVLTHAAPFHSLHLVECFKKVTTYCAQWRIERMFLNALNSPIDNHSTQALSTSHLYLFPFRLPDELHASQASRYHQRSGNSSVRHSYLQLYDTSPFRLTFWVPQHLERFAGKLPGSVIHNIEGLLRQNTLFPLFETYSNARLNLVSETIPIAQQIANMPKRIVGESGETHLCMDCIQSDRYEHGEPYIHRSHQIPGVQVCWRHKTRLMSCCPNCGCPFERKNDFVLAPWEPCYGCGLALVDTDFYIPNREVSEQELSYAIFAKNMLMLPSKPLEAEFLAMMYRTKLAELGFTRGTRIDHQKVIGALEEHFGKDLLAQIDAAYRKKKDQQWMRLCCASAVFDVPLPRHLAISHFLFGEASQFWAFAEQLALKKQLSKSISDYDVPFHAPPSQAGSNSEEIRPPKSSNPESMTGKRSVYARLEAILLRNKDWTERDLWDAYPGLMKELFRINSTEGSVWLKKRLARDSNSEKNEVDSARQNPEDMQWAQRFAKTAIELYSSTEKPKRITRNMLMIEAGWGSGKMPCYARYPVARQQLESLIESDWHFYSRRILWAKFRVAETNSSSRSVLSFSGIEHHQGKSLLEFFSSVPAYTPLGIGTIMQILHEQKIPKDWEGPAGGRKFQKPGRNYSRGGEVPIKVNRH